ncbi:hypothetical protein BLNAU_1043 [Blattamonas nauphoetae]|uniref:Uncharacterized protein n=1 Tax=Blattamonas nauphoetae TaxID=2049346 RepID=A0ABQ9YJY1_9EUKA|nr:hypothetical protein BLNAU_1043 [Blattamonas nauphoetae]
MSPAKWNTLISTDTFQNVVLDVNSFSTIPEPARITTLTLSGYDELDKTAFFSVEGRVFTANEKYTIEVLTSSSAASSFSFTASSTTRGEGSAILFSDDPSKVELKYNTAYTISTVEDKNGDELILHSTFTFSTIEEPGRVMKIGDVVAVDDSNTTTVALVGHNMQIGTFSLELVNVVDETEKPVITASFESDTTGQASASLHPTAELKYGETYRLVKMTTTMENARPVHVEPSLSFIVTDEPSRLTEVGTVVAEDSDRRAKIALTGIKMTNGPFILTLNNSKTLTATFEADGESGTVSGILFSQDDSKVELEYDTEYTVTGLTDKDNKPTFFHSSLSFRTPIEPTRLVKLNMAKYDDDETTVFVELIAQKLGTTGSYSVELALDGDVKHTIDFSFTSDLKWIGSAILYPSSSCELEYGKTYDVSNFTQTLNSLTSSHFFEPNTLEIEAEPSRIESIVSATLNKDRSVMTTKFEGRAFKSELGPVFLVKDANTFESIGNVRFVDSTHCEADFVVGSSEPGLVYDQHYTLARKDGESSFFVNSDVFVRVPAPPRITDLEFSFSNSLHTGCFVKLTGMDLIVGNSLNVTLTSSLFFIATITSETLARSSELLIGWPTTLRHNTNYQITSIEAVNEDDGETLFHYAISDSTASLPDDVVIFVDCGSTSDSTLFCGDRTRPCSTIEDGWKIVEGLGISTLSILIIENTTQKEQVKIMSDHNVLIQSGPSTRPELFVSPSSASSELDGEGMIDVWGGRLRVHDVDVDLSDSPSLIFIRMVGGHLTIKSSSFSTSSQLSHSEDSLCSWRGGAIVLDRSTTTITSTLLNGLSHGAIDMEGGSLKIETSSFHDNNPHSSSFPSLRRNIRCSEGGEIEIESLSGGDGMETPSAWISTSDCSLKAKETISRSPFFVPTLSSSSTSKLNEPQKTLSLIIKGTTLIPCSLFLEVFEKQKDGKDGQNVQIALSPPVCTMFTETELRLYLNLSSLSTLNTSLEWRGRLVFGAGQTTTSSFVVKTAESESSKIVVDWKGSDNREECGTDITPCRTIAAGWEGGVMKREDVLTEICLTVSTQASFGGIVWVGNGAMKLTSKTDRTSRIVVEGTLRREEGKAGNGVVNVDSGRVTFASLTLSLPSSSELDGVGKLSVVWGRGEIVVESVQLEHKTGMVGMGLICLVEGWLSLSAVESKWMEMGEGTVLLEGQSGNKEIVMKLSECTFANTLLHSTPFLSFSSSSPSSSLSISHSSFINMKSTLSPSSSLHPLLSVRTAQPEMAFESCSFENCGVFSSAGESAGSTLQILRSSSSLSSCLFVGWFPAETSADSVRIVVSSAMTRVKLDGTRFEHTQRSSALSPKRAGVLVEYPHSLPVVTRSKAVFSSCSVCLRKISPNRN